MAYRFFIVAVRTAFVVVEGREREFAWLLK
jgi:hypothetical protein